MFSPQDVTHTGNKPASSDVVVYYFSWMDE